MALSTPLVGMFRAHHKAILAPILQGAHDELQHPLKSQCDDLSVHHQMTCSDLWWPPVITFSMQQIASDQEKHEDHSD